jgi:hypothetical protein
VSLDVKPHLHKIHSPDVADVTTYSPAGSSFAVLFQLLVGPTEDRAVEESFDLTVCSPDWLRQAAQPVIGRHLLIVNDYDYDELEGFIRGVLDTYAGRDWPELASKIARFGRWEFEDYTG